MPVNLIRNTNTKFNQFLNANKNTFNLHVYKYTEILKMYIEIVMDLYLSKEHTV